MSRVLNKTEEQERAYLQQILHRLRRNIDRTDGSVKEHVDTLAAHKEYIWANKDLDPHEIRSMRESILNHFALGENVIGKHKRLSALLDSPYFGRMDFREKKENGCVMPVAPIYIGIHTFYDSENQKVLIYDWRTPIAGMFYEYELGEASYLSPGGLRKGAILLKRQYRIRKGKMEYMIESSLVIHDEILQKELSSPTDDKMKNIVATIQREQNRIIRQEEARTLIIQGVAGSGKTSVALHRVAYLLYAWKGNISSKDILIVSPNQVFSDYISNVLPELGEETVAEATMEQILSDVLENKYAYQNFFEQVNELLTHPDQEFINRIRYKASFEFIAELDRFVLFVENTYFHAADVRLTPSVTVPARFIEEQFRRFNRYPMRQRFEAMTDYILEMQKVRYGYLATTSEKNLLKKEIKNMFAGNKDVQVYKDFFEWAGKPGLFKMRKNRMLEYADLAPLAYLHRTLSGNGKTHNHVKHLLIDEMQDYSPIQYKVIQKLFPCQKTVLGDACQSVNPYGGSSADRIQKALATGEIMKLNKSYRSTYEITGFAHKIRPHAELEPVARHGGLPQIVKVANEEEEIRAIVHLISIFRRSVYTSLAVICKTESQAETMTDKLKSQVPDISFLSSQSTAFRQGVVITFAHMAKGLEFDEVILPQTNDKNYQSEMDRSMLYIAATRAIHRLSLTYSGTKCLLGI